MNHAFLRALPCQSCCSRPRDGRLNYLHNASALQHGNRDAGAIGRRVSHGAPTAAAPQIAGWAQGWLRTTHVAHRDFRHLKVTYLACRTTALARRVWAVETAVIITAPATPRPNRLRPEPPRQQRRDGDGEEHGVERHLDQVGAPERECVALGVPLVPIIKTKGITAKPVLPEISCARIESQRHRPRPDPDRGSGCKRASGFRCPARSRRET